MNTPKIGAMAKFGRPSKPPVKSCAMFAPSCKSAMVQIVSMSRVKPRVRNKTRPEAKPTTAAARAASVRLVIGSVQMP